MDNEIKELPCPDFLDREARQDLLERAMFERRVLLGRAWCEEQPGGQGGWHLGAWEEEMRYH